MKYKAEIAMKCDAGHGEDSWWDDRRQKMLFMDCIGQRLFVYDPETGGNREYKLPFNPEAVIGCEDGGYVATSENAIYKLDDDAADPTDGQRKLVYLVMTDPIRVPELNFTLAARWNLLGSYSKQEMEAIELSGSYEYHG